MFSKPKCKCDEVSSLMGGENEKKKLFVHKKIIISQQNILFSPFLTIMVGVCTNRLSKTQCGKIFV